MTPETLVCAENVNPQQLSALRDGGLSTGEARRLREHISSCAACQARLADYDRMASALRSQHELDPGDRIIEGVRARLAGPRGAGHSLRAIWSARGGKRMWTALAALAPVAALILLFVYVFTGIGRQPLPGGTPTAGAATATPTWFKKISPTETPALVQIPTFTPSLSAAQAWGAFDPALTVTLKLNGAGGFLPAVFSPDLSTIGGVIFNSAGNEPVQLAYYTVATGAITRLSPAWHGYGGEPWGGVLSIDSHYIIYGFNSQPGATCGVCHNTLWSFDRATGKTWQFNAGTAGELLDYTSANHVVFASVEGQVWVADIVAHTVNVALPIGAQPATASSPPGPDERILGFQWPYLEYAETSAATPNASQPVTTMNILDLASGVKTLITAPIIDNSGKRVDPNATPEELALTGNTLYAVVHTTLNGVDASGTSVNINYGALYQLNDAFTPGNSFTTLAIWPEKDSGGCLTVMANARLVCLNSGYFWDVAQSRLVKASLGNAYLSGSYILSIDPYILSTDPYGPVPRQTIHAYAYDTSRFLRP
jgi:hypothetical protein